MKIDHLTFGQLLKLQSVENLARVTRAYHKALRRHFDDNDGGGSIEFYTVLLAETYFPEFAAPWKRVLAFLRSPELKLALRRSAKAQRVPRLPGYWATFIMLERRAFPNRKVRWALAGLIVTHCKHSGVPATLRANDNEDFFVYVETNQLGCEVIRHKPGLKWSTISQFCNEMGVDPERVFWWLPKAGDRTGWRINPALWPVNTPDFQETAKQLIYVA